MTPSGTLPIVMKSERKTPNRPIRSATGVLWGLHKDFDIYNWCPVGSSDIDKRFVERDESPHPQWKYSYGCELMCMYRVRELYANIRARALHNKQVCGRDRRVLQSCL